MNNRLSEDIICGLIRTSLGLPEVYGTDPQGFIIPTVYVWIPDINIGRTDKLQIAVSNISSNIIGSQHFENPNDNGIDDVREIITNDLIQIDVMSKNNEALERRFEVLSTLKSTKCQQVQEKEQIKIFNIPSNFSNVSYAEGGSRINRYTFSIYIQNKFIYSDTVGFYDTFNLELDADSIDNQTQITWD